MQGKCAIFSGLAAAGLFAVALFLGAFTQPTPLFAGDVFLGHGRVVHEPASAQTIAVLKGDGTVTPLPLSAVVVTNCGLAVALFIQLDATHLMRADPRQSDMFTAVNGKMVQRKAGPMPWNDAYKLAQSAVLSSHVVIPCTDGRAT